MLLAEKGLEILESLYFQQPEKWAEGYTASLNNLGHIYSSLNRPQDALLLEEKVLAIREALYEQQPEKWAKYYTASLQNLAVTYKLLNRPQDALVLAIKTKVVCESGILSKEQHQNYCSVIDQTIDMLTTQSDSPVANANPKQKNSIVKKPALFYVIIILILALMVNFFWINMKPLVSLFFEKR